MKKILILAILLITLKAWSQSPEKMSYQAVVRDANNTLVSNQVVGMRISILQGSNVGTSIYTETQSPISNENGLVSLEVGGGNIVSGSFSTINWENGPYFIKTETDPTGGSSYSIIGTNQLMSVPYALYAKSSGSIANTSASLYLRKKATIQSISTGTNTSITNYDDITTNDITLNNNSGIITFNRAGEYIITAHTSFLAINPGRKIIWFDCNSNYHPGRIASNEADGTANRLSTSFLGKFDAGDTIQLKVYQNTGVNTDCPNTSQAFDETQVNIKKL